MKAFFDTSCPKCRHSIGWFGCPLDRPPCPRCGAEPDREALQKDNDQIEEFHRLLSLRAFDSTGRELRLKRKHSGLDLVHVSNLLGISISEVSAFEQGLTKPTAEQSTLLDRIYSGEAR
ncbi:helix-turn-helix domain-containing protein [Zavarzinella formosa]|uniref:helix-turn-helix domain-containing protein n=1 Tax=Zavarzinella formosa TaxID=360055 RepID=UPI00031F2010|nr:helix-turn-helix transcriptional regulator [Zavarzinella formosa]